MRLSNSAAVVVVAAALCVPALAAAQGPVTSFSQIGDRLKPGDTVWITDAAGREIQGTIGSITTGSITLKDAGQPTFEVDDVSRVRRRNPARGTWTGAAIGAIAGLGAGIAACAAYPEDDPARGDSCLAAISLAWMPGLGAGALVGAMFPGRRQEVYRAPRPGEGLPLVQTFDQLGTLVNPGDTVRIIDTEGRVAEGKVTTLQPDAISIDFGGGTTFAARDVGLIEWQKRISLKAGALFGLAVGGGIGAIDCGDRYANPEDYPGTQPGSACAASLAIGAGVGAHVGTGLARFIPGSRRFVYGSPAYGDRTAASPRLSIAPIITPRTKGVAVAFAF